MTRTTDQGPAAELVEAPAAQDFDRIETLFGGSGKTTLAAGLSRRLGVPHVELDALHHGPNSREATAEDLRAKVEAVLDDAAAGSSTATTKAGSERSCSTGPSSWSGSTCRCT
jgi:hypothetical protein